MTTNERRPLRDAAEAAGPEASVAPTPDRSGGRHADARYYPEVAVDLWAAGYSPLPLPERAKREPPKGWTGSQNRGRMASRADVQAWVDDPGWARGNTAARLPEEAVGLDVDAYDGKPGAQTWATLVDQHGAPPPSAVVWNRDDGVSGIRLFRLPDGVTEDQLGSGLPGIDIIRHGHRYITAPGSVHPEGRIYGCRDEATGEALDTLPPAATLPVLPLPWAQAFTTAQRKAQEAAGKHRALTPGQPCQAVLTALSDALDTLGSGDSRHDAGCKYVPRLLRLGDQGHAGAERALADLRAEFVTAVGAAREGSKTGKRTIPEALREYGSFVAAGLALIDASPTPDNKRGCCTHPAERVATERRLGDWLGQRTGDSDTGDGDTHADPEAGKDPEPTTWAGQPLDDVLDGTYAPEVPDLMHRSDGHGLLYRGRVHSVHGESESGKSLLMQWAAAVVLGDGGSVLYLDFESDRGSVVGRLLALGATPEAIRERFTYVHPEEPVATPASRAAWGGHLAQRWDLVILDGVTDAMNVLRFARDGGDVNDQATRFIRTVAKQLASATGAAVVLVDHVTKSQDGRGRYAIGAQAKLSGLTGAAYTVEVGAPLAPGQVGELLLRVGKDRPAGVRQWCSPRFRASDRTQEAARASVDSTGGRITVTLKPPADLDPQARPFRPTTLMGRVSDYLAACPEPATMNAITSAVTGQRAMVKMAVDCLVEDRNIERTVGPRNAMLHRLVTPFDPLAWVDEANGGAGRSQSDRTPTEAPDSVRDRVPSREGDAGRSRNGNATDTETQSRRSRDAETQSAFDDLRQAADDLLGEAAP